FWSQRNLPNAGAGRRRDCVGDCRSHGDDTGLADPLGAERTARLALFDDNRLNSQRNVECARDLVVHHRGIAETAGVPDQLLPQSVAEPLHKTALNLALNGQGVNRAPNVVGKPGGRWHDLSGILVDLNLNHLRSEHLDAEIREGKPGHGATFGIKWLAVIDERMLTNNGASKPVVRAK